jgi:APA family basic amino acid/polyamine antiporter
MATKQKVEVRVGRAIGLVDVVMIGIGSMLGGSIFALGGMALSYSGSWFLLVIILNGLLMVVNAMTYIELTFLTKRDGTQISQEVDLHLPPPFGFLSGWMTWVAKMVACAVYADVTSIFLTGMLVPLGQWAPVSGFGVQKSIAVAIFLVLLAMSCIGMRVSRKAQNVLVLVQISIFMTLIVSGTASILLSGRTSATFDSSLPMGPEGIVMAMALTFISFEGAEIITALKGDVRTPKRVISRSVFMAMGIVFALYFLFYLFLMLFIPQADISAAGEKGTLIPIGAKFGELGKFAFSAVIMLSGIIALAVTLFSASRTLFRMGRSGYLPRSFGGLHPRYRTPIAPHVITGVVSILLLVLLPFIMLAATASLLFLIGFTFPNFAVARSRRPKVASGQRSPSYLLFPALVILANISIAVFVLLVEPVAWYIALLLIEVGVLLSYKYGGKRQVMASEVIRETPSVPEPRYHVLVAVSGPTAEKFLSLSGSIAKARNGVVTLLNVYEVPMAVPASEVPSRALGKRTEFMEGLKDRLRDVEVRVVVAISHDTAEAITQEVIAGDVNLMILGWKGTSEKGERIGTTINPIMSIGPCDLLIIRPSLKVRFSKILVCSLSMIAAEGLAEIASVAAKDNEGSITIIQARTEEDSRIVGIMTQRFEKAGIIPEVMVKDGELHKIILAESPAYDFVLVGTEHRTRRRELFGPSPEERLLKGIPTTVALFMKAAEHIPSVSEGRTEETGARPND